MRYLFDTSALLIHYRQETGWQVVQNLFEDIEAEILIASPTLAEFARRLHTLSVEDAEITRVLENYTHLFANIRPIDAAVATAAYTISRQTPERLPLIDALIAAAAQADEAVLVHRDSHMAIIPVEVLPQQFLE